MSKIWDILLLTKRGPKTLIFDIFRPHRKLMAYVTTNIIGTKHDVDNWDER